LLALEAIEDVPEHISDQVAELDDGNEMLRIFRYLDESAIRRLAKATQRLCDRLVTRRIQDGVYTAYTRNVSERALDRRNGML
jgi:IS4 transposase